MKKWALKGRAKLSKAIKCNKVKIYHFFIIWKIEKKWDKVQKKKFIKRRVKKDSNNKVEKCTRKKGRLYKSESLINKLPIWLSTKNVASDYSSWYCWQLDIAEAMKRKVRRALLNRFTSVLKVIKLSFFEMCPLVIGWVELVIYCWRNV